MSILKRLEELYLHAVHPVAVYIDDTSFVELSAECDRRIMQGCLDYWLNQSTDPPTYNGKPVYRVRSRITHIYVAAEQH